MAHYLFVPGGKRTKQDWDALRPLLEADGHRTDAITLSDPARADLSGHVAELCGMIERIDARRLHLVGHSYASFVITGAASALPKRLETLVYLDSIVPVSGQSLFDFFRQANVDPADYGVPAWPPFIEALCFDQDTVNGIPKSYIHCLRSQFMAVTRGIPACVKARPADENWTYFELDSDHYCMIEDPAALADIIRQC